MDQPTNWKQYKDALEIICRQECVQRKAAGEDVLADDIEFNPGITAEVWTRNLFSNLSERERKGLEGFCLSRWQFVRSANAKIEPAEKAEMERIMGEMEKFYMQFRPEAEAIFARPDITVLQRYFLAGVLAPLFPAT